MAMVLRMIIFGDYCWNLIDLLRAECMCMCMSVALTLVACVRDVCC